MAAIFAVTGPWIIDALTSIPEVREASYTYLLWAVILPVTGVLGFQFDGVFLGAMQTKHWRNMMLVSVGIYALMAWGLWRWTATICCGRRLTPFSCCAV